MVMVTLRASQESYQVQGPAVHRREAEAIESARGDHGVRGVMDRAFREYGLPRT